MLKVQYKGDLRELFPQLDIAKVVDIFGKSYEAMKDEPDMNSEYLLDYIGTFFKIKLTEVTKEAVLKSIEAIKDHPLVLCASPNLAFDIC